MLFRVKNQSGFSLLEVLISLVILSIGLLGLASLTAMIIRTNSFSDEFTTATALAQDKLEELVNTSFGSVVTGSDPSLIDENGDAGNTGSKYNRSWTITDNITTKNIQVTVTWSDINANSGQRTINIYTIKSNS